MEAARRAKSAEGKNGGCGLKTDRWMPVPAGAIALRIQPTPGRGMSLAMSVAFILDHPFAGPLSVNFGPLTAVANSLSG